MQRAAAKFPPALSPPTETRFGLIPKSKALSFIQLKAASQSAKGIGYGCSGANRYSTENTFAFNSFDKNPVNAS